MRMLNRSGKGFHSSPMAAAAKRAVQQDTVNVSKLDSNVGLAVPAVTILCVKTGMMN